IYVEAGGVMSYGPHYQAVFAKAAIFVDKNLKRAKPADFPIEQPTKFELVVNLKTPKKLGFELPPRLLALAAPGVEGNDARSLRFSAARLHGRSRLARSSRIGCGASACSWARLPTMMDRVD